MGTIKLNEDFLEEENQEENNENVSAEKLQGFDSLTKENAILLYEDKSRRTESEKHFKTAKGTFLKRDYGTPVHYWSEEDRRWREIDNEFTARAAGDSADEFDMDGFTNKYGAVKVRMAHNLRGGKIVSVTKGEYAIMLSLTGRRRKDRGDFEKSQGEAAIFCHGGKGCEYVQKLHADIHDEPNAGEIRYNDFVKGADLQFILDGEKLKENIVVKEKCESYEFGFSLKTKNLRAALSDDCKSVVFFPCAKGDESIIPFFTLPGAFMTDASGAYSESVEYELTKKSRDAYTLCVVADQNWIESDERQFPVEIDPTIVFGYGSGNYSQSESALSTQSDQYLSHSLTRSGTASLDLLTSDVRFIHPDFTLDDPVLPLDLFHVYNSAYSGVKEPYAETYCGKNWRTSFHQYMGGTWGEPYLIDAMGNRRDFEWRDDSFRLIKDYDTTLVSDFTTHMNYYLTTANGTKMHFGEGGWLSRISDKKGNYIEITRSTSGKISQIEQTLSKSGIVKTIYFSYYGGRLNKITHITPDTQELKYELRFGYAKTGYEYSGAELTEIKYVINSYGSTESAKFSYDGSGNLHCVTDPTARKLSYDFHDGDKKITVTETSGNGVTFGDGSVSEPSRMRQWQIGFYGNERRITHKGETTVLRFDDAGKTESSYRYRNQNGKSKIISRQERYFKDGKNYTVAVDETMPNLVPADCFDELTGWTGYMNKFDDTGTSLERFSMYDVKTIDVEDNSYPLSGKYIKTMGRGNLPLLPKLNKFSRDFPIDPNQKSFVIDFMFKLLHSGFLNAGSPIVTTQLLKNNSFGKVQVIASAEWRSENLAQVWQHGLVCMNNPNQADRIRVCVEYNPNVWSGNDILLFGGLAITPAPFQTETITVEGELIVVTTVVGDETAVRKFKYQKNDFGKLTYESKGPDAIYYGNYSEGRHTSATDLRRRIQTTVLTDKKGNYQNIDKTTIISNMAETKSLTYSDMYTESGGILTMRSYDGSPGASTVQTDLRSGMISSVRGGDGVATTYLYGAHGGELEEAATAQGSQVLKNQYAYTKFLLTQAVSGNNTIQYSYNGFAELKEVKLNGKVVKTYAYKDDTDYGANPAQSDFNFTSEQIPAGGNGSYAQKTYYDRDGFPVKKTESINSGAETLLLTANVDERGRPAAISDKVSGTDFTVAYEELSGGKSKQTVTYSGNRTGSIETVMNEKTGGTKKIKIGNPNAAVTGIIVALGLGGLVAEYEYFPQTLDSTVPTDSVGVCVTPAGGASGRFTSLIRHDFLGRPSAKTTDLLGARLTDEYRYLDDRYNSSQYTTTLIDRVAFMRDGQGIGNVTYEYAQTFNKIATETNILWGLQRYAYDSFGRLVREDNPTFGFTKRFMSTTAGISLR